MAQRRTPDTPGSDALKGVFCLLLFLGVIAGLVWAAVTEVTVPLLWPTAATVGCFWSGYLVLIRAAADRERMREAAAQRAREAATKPDRRTVAEVLDARLRDGQSRIGDAERDIIVNALHTHYAAGRIDVGELDERLAEAMGARTIRDLDVAVRDLPSEVTGR